MLLSNQHVSLSEQTIVILDDLSNIFSLTFHKIFLSYSYSPSQPTPLRTEVLLSYFDDNIEVIRSEYPNFQHQVYKHMCICTLSILCLPPGLKEDPTLVITEAHLSIDLWTSNLKNLAQADFLFHYCVSSFAFISLPIV